MAYASAERQAKKARLDTPSPPNSKNQPTLPDACFAMSSLGWAKLGLHAKSFGDVMPGVREVDAPITGRYGELVRIAAADSLKFKWAGAPLLMMKLWIFSKGLNALSFVPLTEASTAAVLGSMAKLFSLVCGATVTSRDAAVLPDSLPDGFVWAEQPVVSPVKKSAGSAAAAASEKLSAPAAQHASAAAASEGTDAGQRQQGAGLRHSSDHPLPPKGRASPQRTRTGGHMPLLGEKARRETFLKVSEAQHIVDMVISDWQCCLCR